MIYYIDIMGDDTIKRAGMGGTSASQHPTSEPKIKTGTGKPTVEGKGQEIATGKSLLERVMELKSEVDTLVSKKSIEFSKLIEDLKKNINKQFTAEELAKHPSLKHLNDLIEKITDQLKPEKIATHKSIKPLLDLMQDLINEVNKKPEIATHKSIEPLLKKMQDLIDETTRLRKQETEKRAK